MSTIPSLVNDFFKYRYEDDKKVFVKHYNKHRDLISLSVRKKVDEVDLKGDDKDKKRLTLITNLWSAAIFHVTQFCDQELTIDYLDDIQKIIDDTKKYA